MPFLDGMAGTTTSSRTVKALMNTRELWEMVLLHQSIDDLVRLRRLNKATIEAIHSSSKLCKKLFLPHPSFQPVHPHSHPGKFLLINQCQELKLYSPDIEVSLWLCNGGH